MRRMHVHVAVENLQHAIGFYSALFAAQPTVIKKDYAKWIYRLRQRRQRGLSGLARAADDCALGYS